MAKPCCQKPYQLRPLQTQCWKQVHVYKTQLICLYNYAYLLQILTCPEGVRKILNSFDYKNSGEEVAQEVAQTIEKQQVARAVAFLQKHHQEGDLLKGLEEESEAELRNMQAQFRLELQAQTEEKVHQLKHCIVICQQLYRGMRL